MYKNGNFFAWWLILVFAILLIVMGIQGSLGKVLAVIFVPSKLDVLSDSTQTGAFSQTDFTRLFG